MVDFVRTWSEKTELPVERFVGWLGVARGKFFDWRTPLRQGQRSTTRLVPRDHWLEYWEKKAIIDFHAKNPLEGYRRLTFMMLDQGRRRRQPGVDLPRAVRGRLAGSLESQAIQQGDRLRPAAGAARALGTSTSRT